MQMKGWVGFGAFLLAGVVATSAFAQAPGGGRGGRGFGFGGGMGGGQLAAVQLAGNAAVQKDLGVTDDQVAKLKPLTDEASGEFRALFGGQGGPGAQRPSDEERAARDTKRKEIVAKYKPKLAEVLSAQQVERLGQIELQAKRTGAYTDSDVVKALSLSKDQQDKIASLEKDMAEKRRASFQPGGGGDREAAMAKIRELNEAFEKDVAAVLTADQSKQFATMKGKPFDFTQMFQGGPGGGGGRGNRRPSDN